MVVYNSPATGAPGTNAGFFNNLFGGGNNTPPAAPVTPPENTAGPGETPPPHIPNALVTTSGPSRTTFNNNSSALQNALNQLGGPSTPQTPPAGGATPTDPILAGLDSLQKNSDAATKSLIATTQAQYQNKVNQVDKQYTNYKAGLQQLGIEHNEAQASPELLAGHIQQATNDQMDKISALDAERSKALIDAKTAKEENDFKTLEAKMTYIKNLEKQKADAVKNMYDSITQAKNASEDEAANIYSTLNTLDAGDKEAFLVAVSKKYGLPLDALTSAVAVYGKSQQKSDIALSKAKGGGTSGGMSKAQIKFGENKLNESRGDDGYVDPYVYKQAFDDWDGTTKEFLATYPPKNYVNPKAKNLPKYLMPAKTSTSGRSSE